MDKNLIKYAANHYYKENVEGEPLDQDVPVECFIAGAEFILKSQKIRETNCNIFNLSTYNPKIIDTNEDKFVNNIEKIMKITGFYITAPGDPSVGIQPATWELRNDFYFDNQEELEEFRNEIKSLFESYCGEVTDVITFEEEQQMIDADIRQYFEQFPVRYLIRDKDYIDNIYKKAGCTGMYSPNVGTAIHKELPNWIPEEGNVDSEVIKSTDPKFKQILLDEAERLEHEIRNDEMSLKNAKLNLALIQKELKYGQK
jgi:hypothetical protein